MSYEVIRLTQNGLIGTDSLDKLINTVKDGGCIVLPADTCYILVVDALNEDAVKRLFDIKKRARENPIHVCVSSLKKAHEIGFINRKAERLLERLTPGPITVVVKKKNIVPDILVAHTGTIGIRIPDSPSILQFCAEYGKPVTATSANLSGFNIISQPEAAVGIFGDKVRYGVAVDRIEYDNLSTIVKAIDEKIEVLRDGAISRETIIKLL